MVNKNYVRGRNLEYRIKKKLEAQGYFVVRSSGSHTPADLVAIKKQEQITFEKKPPEVILVQCGKITKEKREELEKLAMVTNTKAMFEEIKPLKKKRYKEAKEKHIWFKRKKVGLDA